MRQGVDGGSVAAIDCGSGGGVVPAKCGSGGGGSEGGSGGGSPMVLRTGSTVELSSPLARSVHGLKSSRRGAFRALACVTAD
jgi:hypothetical protein